MEENEFRSKLREICIAHDTHEPGDPESEYGGLSVFEFYVSNGDVFGGDWGNKNLKKEFDDICIDESALKDLWGS